MASIVATNVKKGQCIKYEGETGIVLNLEHRTPGKGNALIAATIRSFQTGNWSFPTQILQALTSWT